MPTKDIVRAIENSYWALTAVRRYVPVMGIVLATVLLLSWEVFGHDPIPASKAPTGGGKVPTVVEPVPLMKNSGQPGNAITNFEFYVGQRYGKWLQEVYEIGTISDEQNEVRLAVVRAYEPGAAIAHVTEATALRIDLRTGSGSERSGRGWLDSHEVVQVVKTLPGMPGINTAAIGAASNRTTEVTFPRGRVAIGFRFVPGDTREQRLFIRVGGTDGVTAFLKSERFAELEALVNAANRTIREVQDKRGHHN